jgi:hypothetical protein
MRRPQCADWCASRPPLPRAPLLWRRYPPSSLLRAHARVLWPPCPFDLSLVGIGLRRLCHPRLVHRTVLALTVWLLPKVSCLLRRVLARCIWSVSSRATTAFANKRWLGALQVLPQATFRGHLFSTLKAFPTITTLSFTCPPGRSRAATRGEGFVARAYLGFVSSSQVEPVTRLNRPISGAGFAPASHRVLLAAPLALGEDAACDPKGCGHSGCVATARDTRGVPLGTEREIAPVDSWALRSSGRVHAPPLASGSMRSGRRTNWLRRRSMGSAAGDESEAP